MRTPERAIFGGLQMRIPEVIAVMPTLNSPHPILQNVSPDLWQEGVRNFLHSAALPIHLVGVGNPLRMDDGVGVFVAKALQARIAGVAKRSITVHDGSGFPDVLLSRLPPDEGLVIFDAVEAGLKPGSIVCATIRDTRFGFFATHNVPLRLIPGISERMDGVLMVGIEPESLDVGEGLSRSVRASADKVVTEILALVEGRE
jgi:hydrogenase maturation protease